MINIVPQNVLYSRIVKVAKNHLNREEIHHDTLDGELKIMLVGESNDKITRTGTDPEAQTSESGSS